MQNFDNVTQNLTVLVTGIGGPAGRSATQYLREKGIKVVGTDIREVDTVVDQFHLVPAADHPDYIQALCRLVEESGASLLVPTVSEELPLVARHKAKIAASGCFVVIANVAAVEIANDKLLTAKFLAEKNISVPGTVDGSLYRDHPEVLSTLGYPLIAKPRISRGGRGVVILETVADLALEQRDGIIFQQFIPGTEFDVNLYIDMTGKTRSCVVLRKNQLRDGMVGNAVSVERTIQTDVADLAKSACEAIGLTGPIDVDIRIDAEGRPALLEINARLGANVLSSREILDDLVSDWHLYVH